MIYKKNAFQGLLEKFACEVDKKNYKKMPYSTWKTINKWNGADIWVNSKTYILEDIDCPFNYCDFEMDDGSFGQFLNDIWKEKNNAPGRAIRYVDTATGEFVDTGLTATASTESNTAITANSINSIKVSPLMVYDSYDSAADYAITSDIGGNWGTIDIDFVTNDEFYKTIEDIKNRLDTKMDINEKENNNNMKMFGNFDFGKVDGNTVRMSMYGLAVKNNVGTWVSYNSATNEVVDVDVMNFDGSNFMYKMPVAIEQVKVGDVVIHNRKPVYVTGIADGKLSAIDVMAGEEKVVLLTRNMFGFNFVTKVVSLMDMTGMTKPSAENPFGNMWMLALMGDGKEFDFKDMLMMQMLSGQVPANGMNPMLMLMLAKDGAADNDMMMALAMSGAFNTNTPVSIPEANR